MLSSFRTPIKAGLPDLKLSILTDSDLYCLLLKYPCSVDRVSLLLIELKAVDLFAIKVVCTLSSAVFASTTKRNDSPIRIVTIILMLAKTESNVKTWNDFTGIPAKRSPRTEMNPAIVGIVKNKA